MRKNILILGFAILFLILGKDVSSYAYDNQKVHQKINKSSVLSSDLGAQLVRLGYPSGIETKLKNVVVKEVWEWFEDGGKLEDVPDCRSKYHFHDPTKPFDSAGLSSSIIDLLCLNWGHRSSLIWAQDQDNQWSWQKARSYYYQALTSADKVAQEQNFANTFRAVGQVMHLLADASVPEHTRNDIHILPFFANATQSFPFQIGSWTYETWCYFHAKDLNTTATAKDYAITNTSVVSGLIPIFNFWDTTPLPISGSFVPVGLAEYSNYNFVSHDTIFKDYTYPVKPIYHFERFQAEDGQYDTKVYFSGTTSDNIAVNHLASTGYLWADLENISPLSMDAAKFNLDDNCFNDYANILVPKAVGYSAGLLNYFFRGKLDARLVPGGIKVKNLNTEEMTSGTISVYYDDNTNTTKPIRHFLASLDLSTPLTSGQEIILSFVTPTDNIKPGSYIVVFRGKLGNEEGAVIGKIAHPQIYYWKHENGLVKIYKMDTDGSNDTVVYENTSNDRTGKITVSPDGNALAFAANKSVVKLVYLTSLPATTATVLVNGNRPDWSPDGTKIVFEQSGVIFSIDMATRVVKQLTADTGGVPAVVISQEPAWSPDGTMIAYSKMDSHLPECNGGRRLIYLMDASGSPLGPVTCHTADDFKWDSVPTWSPNGQEIAFLKGPGEIVVNKVPTFQLYKVDVATKMITKLTDSTDDGYYEELDPAWSPDGTTIAVSSNLYGDWDVWLVDAQGGGYKLNLTSANLGWDDYPAFGN